MSDDDDSTASHEQHAEHNSWIEFWRYRDVRRHFSQWQRRGSVSDYMIGDATVSVTDDGVTVIYDVVTGCARRWRRVRWADARLDEPVAEQHDLDHAARE